MTDAEFKQRLGWSFVSIFVFGGGVIVVSLALGYGDPDQLKSSALIWFGILTFMMGSFVGHFFRRRPTPEFAQAGSSESDPLADAPPDTATGPDAPTDALSDSAPGPDAPADAQADSSAKRDSVDRGDDRLGGGFDRVDQLGERGCPGLRN